MAPPLMWSEARSGLHEALWRGELSAGAAARVLSELEGCPVEPRTDPRMGAEAWRVAEELGWAKTYDAEYVALALLLGTRLVTLDGRLRRGADRFGCVVAPHEL